MRKRTFALVGVAMALMLFTWVAGAAEPAVTFETIDRETHRDIEVATPLVSYIFSEDGGVMKSAYLTFAPYGSTVIELVPGTTTLEREDDDALVRQYSKLSEYPFSIAGNEGELYSSEISEGVDGELILEFTGSYEGAQIAKRFTIRPDSFYVVDFQLQIDNPSDEPLPIDVVLGKRILNDKSPDLHYLYDGVASVNLLAEGSYYDFGGLGLLDKQTVFFLSAENGGQLDPFALRAEDGEQRYGVRLTAESGRTELDSSLYGGRRRYLLMEAAGLAILDEPGVGSRMMIPVIRFLSMLYNATGNYGWAIILLTILVRVILYPLMRKQYHSMARMQKLQPKLKQLQERFKDDKQLLQQKMMKLYKDEKVNPMGGCLPMFVQLPIIYVIWRAVLYSAELIHLSPGFLWIPDLSLHDPYFILVVLTTAIMVLQQYLMSPMTASGGADQPATAKYMGYLFPLMMAFLLWRFPAGLWLYYLLTTAAQVGQQAFVNWEMRRADGPSGTIDVSATVESEDDGDAEA